MFQRLIGDLKDSTGNALRLTSLAAAAAMALFVTTAFLVRRRLRVRAAKIRPGGGVPDRRRDLLRGHADCGRQLHGAQAADRGARAEQAAKAAKSTAQTVLADPMLVAAGIQVVRAIGVKKLIPILAVGGLALGFLASRAQSGGARRRRSRRAR